jgi:hypothetical protein
MLLKLDASGAIEFLEFLDPFQPIFDGFCRKNIVQVR